MTDPKSRVQLAQELLSGGIPLLAAAVADLRETVYDLNPGILRHDGWLSDLRGDVDERETQPHPIARTNHTGVILCNNDIIPFDGPITGCALPLGHTGGCSNEPAHPAPPPGWYMCEACEARGATSNLLVNGEPWARVCQPCSLDEGVAKGRIRYRRAKTAALSALTHEGATAAEWASRYADLKAHYDEWIARIIDGKGDPEKEAALATIRECMDELARRCDAYQAERDEAAARYASLTAAAYPVLAWLPRNDPGARMVAERLTGVLAGESGDDRPPCADWCDGCRKERHGESAAHTPGDPTIDAGSPSPDEDPYFEAIGQAIDDVLGWNSDEDREGGDYPARIIEAAGELTRLKEENARVRREAADAWESSRLEREHRVKAIDALADEKAAHEVTRRELESERQHSREVVLHNQRLATVVEAARGFLDTPRGKDDDAMWKLVESLSALDQPTQAEPATPPESPVPAEAPREIRVPERVTVDFGDDAGAVFYRVERWTKEELDRAKEEGARLYRELGGEPPAERHVVGEGEL